MSSYVQYTGNGSTTTFSVTFPYLSQTHVVVTVDGNVKLSPADFEWLSAASIGFRVAPSGTITIRRITERASPLVSFENGSVLTEDELNTAHLQNFYITQELQDALDGYINGGIAFYTSGSLLGSTVQQRIDAAAAEILNSTLLADLNTRIADIDTNAESIIATNLELVNIQDQITALDSTNGGTAALVTAEAASRVAGDTAIAETIALIGAKSGDNLSFILDLNKVKVSGSESLATRLSTLASTDGANSAAIAAEQITRANADSALSSSITTLNTTVGGNSASISTHQTTLNGLVAQYMVKLDVNGHVAGFGLYNSGGSSTFIINASKFAVSDAGTSKIPFVISGGVCYMQNVVIQDALIANLTVGKLTTGTLTATVTQNADWNVGTGRIIWDNGSYMKVSGVGFGTTNQFIEWFGPKMAISACAESNAISYLKTNGGAYFGGALLAGVLKNSVQGTNLTSANIADLGPFSSNGGLITITGSFSFSGRITYAGTSGGLSSYNAKTKENPTFTVVLSRSLGGGAFVDVGTYAVTGSHAEEAPVPADVAPGFYRQDAGWSTTYVDNGYSVSSRQFKLRFTAWNVNTTVIANTLSITSTE